MSPKKSPARKTAKAASRSKPKKVAKSPGKRAAVKKVSTAKAKKAAPKKTAAKRTAKKVASSKSKKTTSKKTASPKKKVAKKVATKRATTTKKSVKKSSVKKAVSKKASPKKVAAKKASAKKATAKKVPVKRAAPKQTAKKTRAQTKVEKNLGGTATASPAPKRAAKKNTGDYGKFRLMLQTLRRRLHGDVNMMSAEALGGSDGAADNHAPIHPAEVGTHSFEQEFTLNLLSSDGDRLEQIEAALAKFSDQTYGSCEECGSRIPRARLEVIPDTPYCVKCASRLEG